DDFPEPYLQKSPSTECSDNLAPDMSQCVEQHTELYTHQEVDEDVEDSPIRASLNSRLSQSKPITIAASRSGESSTASSLKEFERLESEMRAKGSHHGSSDSLGSSFEGRAAVGRGSDRDEHSMSSSINEFEKLEKDCSEAEAIERRAQEEAARLSEIEEGHESQASQETLSDPGNHGSDDTDSDYEKRMSEIEDMMKISQKSISRGQIDNNTTTTDSQSIDKSISDDMREDKTRSQSQSASAAQLILTRKVVSTESTDSHPKSSISTINTDSLIDRIGDLEREYRDDNKSMSSDEFKDDSIHELDFQSETMNENMSANLTCESGGPALATLREETDFEEDSLRDSFHGIAKPLECMLSSTDSMEVTNSGATHATYQYDTGMSSSINSYLTSGDESTMISSTDTTELFNASPDPLHSDQRSQFRHHFEDDIPDEFEEIQTEDQRGNIKIIRRIKRSVPPSQQTAGASSSSESEEKFLEKLRMSAEAGNEVIEEEKGFDEYGNVVIRRTVKTISTQGPDLTKKSVSGQLAQKETDEFLEPFTKLETITNVDEYEGVDELGNPYKVYQEVTVRPEVRTLTFSGPDAQKQLDQFMSTWSGDKSELIEINQQNSNQSSNRESNISDSNKAENFGKQNGKRSQNKENFSTFTGNTRVLTETVSDTDGHTTVMETTIYHSQEPQESDALRESMTQILDDFLSDGSAAKKS
ncbi:unnamed protein product, partial [Oppiella nova]